MGFDLLSRFRKRLADDPPPTESWPLFAFGKLPVYKDFISAGLTDDASREFRDWLSNGFSRHWSSRDDCRSTEIPLHAFLLRLPESRKLAVGALWGSTDQGGLRKFPFALFTILAAGKPTATVLTGLDYLPVFETRAREIRRKYNAGGSLAAVYQELRGARIEIPVRTQDQIRARLASALSRSRIGSLATALFGDAAVTQWAALVSGLDAAARRPSAGAAAFRLPLADEEKMAPLDQLKLWTLRLARLSPAGGGPSGVLYRTEGAMPCGVIFFRDARAEDIFLFHPEAIPTDFAEEIPPPAPTAEAAPKVAIEPAAIEPTAVEHAAIEPAAIEPTAVEPPAVEQAAVEPAAIEPPAIEPPAVEPAAVEQAAVESAAIEPAAIEPAAIEPPAVEPAIAEPATAASLTAPDEVPPNLEPETAVNAVLPSEAAPPAATPPAVEILRLGAAAVIGEVRPVSLPAEPSPEAAPAAPAASEHATASEPPPVREPAASEPVLPPASPPPAVPAGWDLPLASLLEGA